MSKIETEIFLNNSPWIKALKRNRHVVSLGRADSADIVIVGGGISGVLTAYFLLKNTSKTIVLVEKDLVAHGATGHNAGQVVDYFERPLTDIANEYGVQQTVQAQQLLDNAWVLLENIIQQEQLQVRLSYVDGIDYYKDEALLADHIKDEIFLNSNGIAKKHFFYHDSLHHPIGKKVRQNELPENYVAYAISKKGLINSAVFTEELAGVLLTQYSNRFTLYEKSEVTAISFSDKCMIHSNADIRSNHVILCTNGFRNFTVHGIDLSKKMIGVVGYMAGYFTNKHEKEAATSYYTKKSTATRIHQQEPYIYLTKRFFTHNKKAGMLECYGGPEVHLQENEKYEKNKQYEKEPEKQFSFVHIPFDFTWHGLMGYTPHGLREIGKDTHNNRLLYNLGCNGAGILTSVMGAKQIADIFQDLDYKTIFNP